MGTKEAGHTSTVSNKGKREKIHKFPHEVNKCFHGQSLSSLFYCGSSIHGLQRGAVVDD